MANGKYQIPSSPRDDVANGKSQISNRGLQFDICHLIFDVEIGHE
jgi:hypothetical protein